VAVLEELAFPGTVIFDRFPLPKTFISSLLNVKIEKHYQIVGFLPKGMTTRTQLQLKNQPLLNCSIAIYLKIDQQTSVLVAKKRLGYPAGVSG
jgi:hypothetical protein